MPVTFCVTVRIRETILEIDNGLSNTCQNNCTCIDYNVNFSCIFTPGFIDKNVAQVLKTA